MAKSVANPTPKISCWHPQKEVNLLRAILEIASEPVESYDPRINLFDRINKNMEKSLTDREILDKIKELRERFKKRCWKIEVANCYVKRTVVFDISEKIWGKEWEMEIELKRKKKEEMDAKRCDDSSKVNPEEGSSPNHKREHELGKKQDGVESKNEWQPARKKQKKHVARDCFEKKIAKQLTKQQHSEHISKGSVVLQLRAENKCKEPSDGSVFVSSKVNPQEASRPNCEREHELTKKRNNAEPNYDQQPAEQKVKERLCHFCRKSGHIVRDCVEKKIAKQPTKHQHTEDILNGSAVLQFRAENKCEEMSGGSVFVSSRVNPREAFSPNCEREHELTKRQNDAEPNYELQPAKQKVKDKICRFCKKFGHIARDCFEKKIAKQPTKQQETEDISNGSVVLQFGAENKCEELSGGSVFVSSKVNPQEASTPNCEREHELTTKCNVAERNHEQQPAKQKVKERFCRFCRKFGHIARDCFEKKIAKQLTKQQETEDISKGSVVLQVGEENKCEELSGGSVFVSSKVNPQEASRPNCEREHELTTKCNDVELNHERRPVQQKVKERLCYFCKKPGHIARDCFEKKLAKQQETKDISKGSVELQFEAESKCEESSGESAVASSQPAFLQLRSEQTRQRGEVPSGSLPVAHEPFWEQRMKVYYSSQPNANQHASGQGIQDFSNFRPCAQEHRSHQMNPYNGFQPASHQYPSDLWTRESFTSPISPQPPNWGPPPIPPQPPNGGPPPIPPQPPNTGPPLQPLNSGPSLVPPQPPNWGPPPIPPQPPNWRLPPPRANWRLPLIPPQPGNWELPLIPLQPPNCGPPPSPPQPPNCAPPPSPPQPPDVGPPPVPPQPSNWGPPPIPPQPDNWGPPSIPPQPPNCGLSPIPSQPPNCGPPSSPPQPPDGGPPPLPPGPPPSPLQPPDGGPPPVPPQPPNWGLPPQPPNCGLPSSPPQPPDVGPPPLPPGPRPSPLQPPDGGPPPVPPQPPNWGLPPQPPNWGPPPIPPQLANWGPPPVPSQPPNWAPPPIPPQPSNWGHPPVPPKWGLPPQPPNWGPSPIPPQHSSYGPPSPITMPYSYPAPPIPYQYPPHSMFLHKKL